MSIQGKNNDLQEIIFTELYNLFDKNSAQLFKYPIDTSECTDYLKIIKEPIDLSTIGKKFKQGNYIYLQNVEKDIKQIIKNCSMYNKQHPEIMKMAHQFNKERERLKKNLKQQLKKRRISIDKKIKITQEKKQFFIKFQQKRKKNKQQVFRVLGEIQIQQNQQQQKREQQQAQVQVQIQQKQKQIPIKQEFQEVQQVYEPMVEENKVDNQQLQKSNLKSEKKKKTRVIEIYEEMEAERREKQEQQEEKRQIVEEDRYFIEQYGYRNNRLLIEKYGNRLRLDWQKFLSKNMQQNRLGSNIKWSS